METIAYQIDDEWMEVALDALGVGISIRIELGTHGASKVTLPLAMLPPEIAPAIPFEAQCILRTGRDGSGASWSGGSILFQGRRTDNSGQASGGSANQELVIEDAWYDLRFITLQAAWQNITGYSGSTPTYGTPFTWPDCVLFESSPGGPMNPDGSFGDYSPAPVEYHITTGQSIKEVLAYAIYFGGVNLQIGEIDPAVYVPFYPVRSMRCADCIKMALRVHPDCMTEIDYTTTPPTFNIRARANLTTVTLPYKSSSDGKTHLTSQVRPLPELQVSRVGIYIKETSQVNGQDVVSVGTDIYPAVPTSLRSLDASLDMTGPKISKTTAKLTSASFDPTDLAWWAKKVQSLKPQSAGGQIPDSGAGALQIVDATINGIFADHPKGIQVKDDEGNPIDLDDYAYELVSGTVSDWMKTYDDSPVTVVDANVAAVFSYYKETTAGDANLVDVMGEHIHSCRVKLVNTATNTFKLNQIISTGEIYPAGLAQAIYESLSTLQYNFTHTILDSPFSSMIKPGKHCLNLFGGASAWETMNALIQNVEMELFFGNEITTAKTTVSCGPVAHLEAGELVQLFNLFCNRDLSKINPAERSSGVDMSGGNVPLPDDTPRENSIAAQSVPVTTNHAYVSAGVCEGKIVTSAKMISDILAATTPTPADSFTADDLKTMTPREVACCDESGQIVNAIFHSTGFYLKS